MNKNVLIIEDDEDIQVVLTEFLEINGYNVQCASSADEGVHLYKEIAAEYVLVDMRMPDKDGLDVILELKDIAPPYVVFIAMSGEPTDGDDLGMLGAADLLGADYTITKPFDMGILLDILKQDDEYAHAA
ncbi:MAG: response regulator [Bdellovibrionaceae bacterium]|mgnify:CR=1 FL=1|jgi:DNA-binding response OmpR family regulator|nr:response regulator [Pseudobdellovibrionaceae bacterium]